MKLCWASALPVGIQEEVDMIRAFAEDSRVDLLAKWIGVMISAGHIK